MVSFVTAALADRPAMSNGHLLTLLYDSGGAMHSKKRLPRVAAAILSDAFGHRASREIRGRNEASPSLGQCLYFSDPGPGRLLIFGLGHDPQDGLRV